MSMNKGLIPPLLCLFLFSCQNSGNSPSSAPAERDYLAIALAIAPTTTYTIPGDLEQGCYFNDQIIAEGASVTAYNSSSVPYGQSCVSETRTCSAGILSGSFSFGSCAVSQPESCIFNGATVENGQTVTAYTNSSVPYGQSCEAEVRTCNNGVLSGSNQYANCSLDAAASCLFNGQTISHGQNIGAFLSSTVSFGQECQLEYRTCDDGVLSGSNQYATCSVAAAASCLFDGRTIAHGESVTGFLSSATDYGSSCSGETRTCNNGVLSGSYQYGSCEVGQPAACLFNGQTISHGQTVNAYSSSNVEYGQLCEAETRICDNGHLSGSFSFSSCDAGQAMSCIFNGQTVPHGATVTGYENSTVINGSSCSAETRTCDNGNLSGSFSFASCEVNAPASCLFNGQTIINGQSVVAYKTSTATDTCESEIRTCSEGVLSGTYSNANCITESSDDNSDDNSDDDNVDNNDDVKICKHVVEIKHKEHYIHHPNNGLHLGWYKYKERFNCGKHKGWYKHHNKHKKPCLNNQPKWYKDKTSDDDSSDDNH